MLITKKNKDGKMTLEKIGRMVADGFGEVNEKMATKEEMRSGFQEVNQRLGKLEYRVNEVYEIVVDREKDFRFTSQSKES